MIEVRGPTNNICKCVQNGTPLRFPPDKSVIEIVAIGELFWETVGRVVHDEGVRRAECDPYLGRTVG